MLANYIICEFYNEYVCNIYKHLCPEERPKNAEGAFIDGQVMMDMLHGVINCAIKAQGGFLYTYPVSDAAIYRRLLFDNPDAAEDLKRRTTTTSDRNSAPNYPSRVTITNPISDKKKQRNKIYIVEDTSDEGNAVSLDIKFLNSFTFFFPDNSEQIQVIRVGAGQSLLRLLFDMYFTPNPAYDPDPSKKDNPANRRYAAGPYYNQIIEIIKAYDEEYPLNGSSEADNAGGGRRAHDFNPSYAHSSIHIGIYTTITSISLRFLLYFFKIILSGILSRDGVRTKEHILKVTKGLIVRGHVTIFDFSCGFLDYDVDGNEQTEDVICQMTSHGPTQEAGKRIMTASASIKREKKNVTRSRRRIHRTRRTRNTKTKKYYLRKTRHTLKKKNKSKSMRRRNK